MSGSQVAKADLLLSTDGSSDGHPHVLILAFPAQGHVTPLMELAKRLAAEGIETTFACMQYTHEKMSQAWKRSRDFHRFGHLIRLRGIDDGLPPEFNRETWSPQRDEAVRFGLEEGALQLVSNLASEGRPITCIISDFFLRWSSSLAVKVGVHEWIFWPQSAANFSIFLHTEEIISSGLDPYQAAAGNSVSKDSLVVEMGAPLSQRKQDSEVVTCIPGFPSGVPIQYLPFGTPMGDAGAEWLRKFMTECWDRVSQAQGVIGNSFEALEEDILEGLAQRLKEVEHHAEDARRWPRSFRLVGPLVVDGMLSGRAEEADETNEQISGTSFWKEEVTECIDWLDKQPVASVVYVAFGSLTVLTTAQVQEVLLGLAASGQKFLMVLRNDAIISKPLSRTESSDMALPTRLPVEKALPSGFLELYQERCKLVPWAPQALVLAHPSVGGFFSHCGWNSTLESLCCGVPILGWPWLMDQTSNCWLLSDIWRVGLRLSCDEANQTTKEEVEDGVRKLMEGSLAESLRARASKIRDQAREAARRNHIIVSLAKEIHHLALSS